MTKVLRDEWPQFTGNEALPLTTFVKSDPYDKPDTDTSSLRGWRDITTREELQEIVATQRQLTL